MSRFRWWYSLFAPVGMEDRIRNINDLYRSISTLISEIIKLKQEHLTLQHRGAGNESLNRIRKKITRVRTKIDSQIESLININPFGSDMQYANRKRKIIRSR